MPIHFRCTSCNRMLSIARRKAGALVDCPKCGRQVSVPVLSGMAVASNPITSSSQPIEELPLFEQFNFEDLLKPDPKQAVRHPEPSVRAEGRTNKPPAAANQPEVEASPELVAIDGFCFSRKQLTLMSIAIGVLLIMAFALGYLLALVNASKS